MVQPSSEFKSALSVNEGIPQPSSVSFDSVAKHKSNKKRKLAWMIMFQVLRHKTV